MKYHLGFLGGGQLARMSIQAAQRMGLRCVFLDPGENPPASYFAEQIKGSLSDPEAIRKIFNEAESITLENEFIPAEAIFEALQSWRDESRLIPGIASIATVQDKLKQRNALAAKHVPSPKAVAIEGDGTDALKAIGLPAVLKARFGGYDGKGTRYAHTPEEWESHRPLWEGGGWLAEQFVPFKRELAVMVAIEGDTVLTFPTVETVQVHSVCDLVYPSGTDASKIAIEAVRAVGGTGLFGVELFELPHGEILVNELAPRPHNTGHYTLDWGGPSQFEMHVRAVLGLDLPRPDSEGFAVMANLLGQEGAGDYFPAIKAALKTPNCFVHWYQKQDAKPGRKMGHLNVKGARRDSVKEAVEAAKQARTAFYGVWTGQ